MAEDNFAQQTIDLGVVVTDLEKSLKFYKEVVGFSEREGFDVTGKFPKQVGLTDGSSAFHPRPYPWRGRSGDQTQTDASRCQETHAYN